MKRVSQIEVELNHLDEKAAIDGREGEAMGALY